MTRPEALWRAQQQINQTAQLEPCDDTFEPNNNSYNPNPGFKYNDKDGEGGGDLTWVTLSDDPTWVTLSDDPTWGTSCVQEPNPIDILVAASNERYIQQAREFNWRVLLNHLHPVYMTQKLVTNNWAKPNSYNDFTETCSCVKTYRTVDLVDIYGALPFTTALTQFLEPRSQRLNARGKKHARNMRKPFTAAADLYRRLEEESDAVVFQILKFSKQQVLAFVTCPACFGPQSLDTSLYPTTTRDCLVVCLDGNFQHRHHTKASRNHEALRTPAIFLEQSEVDHATNQCTESHKAADDKRNESTWKGCDDTGLMGCCCRHNAAIYLANIHKSGEQRCFPLAIIKKLLSEINPSRPVGILYDIGCSMDKFINLVSRFPLCIKLAGGTLLFIYGLVFPTSETAPPRRPTTNQVWYVSLPRICSQLDLPVRLPSAP
ncbi:hypothetical protein PCANC_28622 [Puccinia coronata f. sp. avenae]|uniref:CxC1-like cysteine cluster associated with KDZ transposases domain-containing protein n=1 Tax=Puccinia coronata f. sp. avenae TaxID=200324 RepID=A0A2N5RV93_9BASI|nr:hypothetical protein PCANC_28622 [Puccinia coronata f. sp. avenae]